MAGHTTNKEKLAMTKVMVTFVVEKDKLAEAVRIVLDAGENVGVYSC